MTWRACDHGDGPEPLPPEELLRIRRVLVERARPEVRGQHIRMAAAEARRAHTVSSAQALARRSARVIAGVAATIVVTSSLAGASILVEPARAIFPAVSDHLIPHRSADQDPGDYAPADDADVEPEESSTTRPDRGTAKAPKPVVQDSVTTAPSATKTTSTTVATTTAPSTSSTLLPTTTSEPDESTTTTTEPDGSTTTTTEPDGSTTTTTEPGGSTTTTTAAAEKTKVPPAWGRDPA